MADAASPYPLSDLFRYAGGAAVSNDNLGDPELQYFLNKGYLSPQSSNEGQTTFSYNSNLIPKSSTGQSFGSFWTPGGISGVLKMINPSAVTKDPNYGTITSNANQYQPADWTRYGYPIMEALAGAGMFSAISAVGGAEAGLSGIDKSIFNTLGKGIMNFGAGGTQTTQNTGASQMNPLLAILSLLSRYGKGGTTPS